MFIPVIGFLTLFAMTCTLVGLGLTETFNQPGFGSTAVIVAVLAALLYGARLEWALSLTKEKTQNAKIGGNDLANFVAVVIGAIIAYFINVTLGLGGVVAVGLVGVTANLVAPKHDVPVYCGGIMGMASGALLPTYAYVLLAAIIAGIVFVISKFTFNGFGGKLGTTAITGCVLTALITGQPFGSSPVPAGDVILLYVIYCAMGAVLSFGVKEYFKHNAVMSSALIALLAGLLLPALNPQMGGALAVVASVGAFAGMSAPARIPNLAYMFVAGIIGGVIYSYTSPYLGGAGGKLGTTAFSSVVALNAMISLAKNFSGKSQVQQAKTPH